MGRCTHKAAETLSDLTVSNMLVSKGLKYLLTQKVKDTVSAHTIREIVTDGHAD